MFVKIAICKNCSFDVKCSYSVPTQLLLDPVFLKPLQKLVDTKFTFKKLPGLHT